MEFSTSSHQNLNAGVKMLVYGPAGHGKTVLAATLPNPVLLSAEAGTLSLGRANLERIYGVGNPTITYDMPLIIIHNLNDLIEAYQWLSLSQEAKRFQSVGIDSISEIAEVVLNNAKKGAKDPRMAYGTMIEQMTDTIRKLRDLAGKHVYMSAKMGMQKDEATQITKYAPDMPGNKLGQAMPYFPDIVLAMRLGKNPDGSTFRYLQTQPDLQYDAKDRSGSLALMEYPHLGAIIDKAVHGINL